MKIGNENYYIIESVEELEAMLQNLAPDFTEDFCELIEGCKKDNINFKEAGIYQIEYEVENPCKHGFRVDKIDIDEIITYYTNCMILLEYSNK